MVCCSLGHCPSEFSRYGQAVGRAIRCEIAEVSWRITHPTPPDPTRSQTCRTHAPHHAPHTPRATPRPWLPLVAQGEMLFLPSAWWHEVDTFASEMPSSSPSPSPTGRALSINFWFRAEWPTTTLRQLEAEIDHLDPRSRAPALRQLGFDLAQRGRAFEASALLQRALTLAPGDAEAGEALAGLRARFGDFAGRGGAVPWHDGHHGATAQPAAPRR